MNVTSKGRYALQVMLDLAQQPAESYVSLKTISERQDISMKYLECIVGQLKKAQLLDAARGKEGGYRLNRSPEAYSVWEILQCLEDNLAPVSCIREDGTVLCGRAKGCVTLPMWRELDEITNRYLSQVTLRDLLTGERWR